MVFEASLTWLLQLSFGFFFFTFTALFFIVSILGFFLKLKPCCSCEICQTFITSSWTLEHNNLCDWYSHLLSKSPTGTIHVHVLGNVITANPENVEHMLKTRFDNYPKGKPFSAILGDLLGRGIFNADGDLWRFQRKMASLELGSVSVRSYAFNIVTTEIESRLIPLLSSVADKAVNGSSVLWIYKTFCDDFRLIVSVAFPSDWTPAVCASRFPSRNSRRLLISLPNCRRKGQSLLPR
ncbi:UNVERIFIED_CONTAM: cytochrome [Sesamum calycinum]|uniref:Cytochrome n=1 Tax=Sesamum calycinum TaxID=2727403 RepID=A0AAW2SEB9_9LAMI